MPKYEFDERGIITITSDCNDSVSRNPSSVRSNASACRILRNIGTASFVVSAIICIIIYLFFYIDVTNIDNAFYFLTDRLSEFELVLDFFEDTFERYEIDLLLEDFFYRLENIFDYYMDVFEDIVIRAENLITEIIYKINEFRYMWR